LGLSEHTDALIVLVSEETGEISIAFEGRFIAVHNEENFVKQLKQILAPSKEK
jgi:DNA integrity scanning protein DisA with diadenylate cyclase activity